MANPLASALIGRLNPQAPQPGLSAAMMPTPASAQPNAFAIQPPPPQAPQRQTIQGGPLTNSLAEALMASAHQSPNRNWFEALGNLGKLYSGNRRQEKFAAAQGERAAAAAEAQRKAELEDFAVKKAIEAQYATKAQGPIKLGPNETLLHPDTHQPIYTSPEAAPKPTTDIQEYQFYSEQMRAAGQEPLPFDQFQIAQKKAGATSVTTNVGGEQLTPGQKKIDEAFADEYVEWVSKGGFADVDKQVSQLNEALSIIESNPGITGPTIGLVPDYLQPYFNEQGVIARDAVEEVVQRNLRAILGPQFTEEEGKRLIARAYNPQLLPAENARRVRTLMTQIVAMGQAKQASVDYFNENGTLRGYTGARPSVADLDKIDFGKTPAPDAAKPSRFNDPAYGFDEEGAVATPAGVDPELWNLMTPEQRALWN